jgi:hypothetical protein
LSVLALEFTLQRALGSKTLQEIDVVFRSEAVKELGQAPSRPAIFQGFRRFRSEPVPLFHSLSAKARTFAERKTTLADRCNWW